jgi:hypothetical protein
MLGKSNLGRGQRTGMGFGFKGSSPPWPYVGRGRGGLPRCGYYLNRGENASKATQPFSSAADTSSLREQAEALRKELEMVETKLRDLESKK